MPGPFPDVVHGGVVVRDSDGTPVSPGSVSVTNVYTPDPAFQMTCPQTAYPDDPCLFQVRGAQLNMIDSQLLALAECWSATGPYDCTDPTVLCDLFTKWVSDTLPGLVASTFNDCAGNDHVPGASIPSCAEMNAAISTAIDAAKPKMCDGSNITDAVRLMDVATLTSYNTGYAFGADGAGNCPALIDWYWDQGAQSLTGGRVHNGNEAGGFASLVGNGVNNVAKGDYSVVVGGIANTASGFLASVGGGQSIVASGDYSTVGGGATNTASAVYTTVGGGYENTASGEYSTVSGGTSSAASGVYSTVGGGAANAASGDYSIIGGGYANTASGVYSTVGGGQSNVASLDAATVSGGLQNSATAIAAAIGGGELNVASGTRSTIAGGYNNRAPGNYSAIGGGYSNAASAEAATVGGGSTNTASGYIATIGGGYNNNASGQYAFLGGGISNTASGHYSTLGGGSSNTASGYIATIGGGVSNTASGAYSIIGGGLGNATAGSYAAIGGGFYNVATGNFSFVGSGQRNNALGSHDVVAGGWDNTITSTTGVRNTIGGGEINRIQGRITGHNTIGGGVSNLIESTAPTSAITGGFIGGGSGNKIRITADQTGNGNFSAILGGSVNELRGYLSSVIGGYNNQIGVSGNQSTYIQTAIVGGENNQLYVETGTPASSYNVGSVILGNTNVVAASGNSSNLTVIGESNLVRGSRRQVFGLEITASNAAGTAQDNSVYIAGPGQQLSFYNVPAVARQTLPAVPTVADIATALRNLGLIA